MIKKPSIENVNKTSLFTPPVSEGGQENFVLKLRLATRKENWLHLSTPEEVLEILQKKRPEGLFLRHPRWAFWDLDGADGDQALVDKAVRLVFARAGFREGEDHRRLASGGKGIRVVSTFLTQTEEEAKFIQEHIYLIAEETWVEVDKKPSIIEELEEKLSNYEKERKEKVKKLDFLYEKKDWAGIKKVNSEIASLDLKIDKLKEKISCYDAKNKRVRANLFIDKAFGNRKQPERICGWDGKKKWGRLLKVGQKITSASHYRRLCNPPGDKAKATIKQAREILPSELGADGKLKKIIEAQKKRKQLLKKVAHKKFEWIFWLLDEETDKILSQLERTVWETQLENVEDIEELALTVFLATQEKGTRNKLETENIIGLKGKCPVCQEKDKAYIKRVNGRYFLRCHKGSCTLNQSLVSYCIEKRLLSPDLLTKDKKAKKKIKRKAGLGNYLSPEFKSLSPKEAAEEALKILAKENNILISWLTGEGKTTFAAILAAKLGKKVWILCYSWEEALEFAGLISKLGVEPVLVPSKKDECKNFKKIENVRERELADAHICNKCKNHPARGGSCKVIKTLTDPEPRIYIGVHSHLEFAKQHADLIIIDEVHKLVKKEKVSLENLKEEIWYTITEISSKNPEAEEVAWKIYNYFQDLIPPALLKHEVLPEAIPVEIKEAANLLLSAIEKYIGEGKLHQARVALEDVNADRSYVWRALSALSAIATSRATVSWSRKRNKIVGELLYYDAPDLSNYEGKLVLLSATAPPSIVKNCLNLEKLNWKCYLLPRKGKIVGINTISSTGKPALKHGLTKPVQNALAISNPEAVVCYKQNKDELSNAFLDDKIVTWGQHEGTNRLKNVSSLAIIGRPTPPPGEIVDWLLLTDNPAETLYWLLVSPIIQAIGRLRKLWKDENATVFLIDNHVLQLQKFLLAWLGPFDLIFWATDKQKDTERKVVALKEALKEKERRKVEEVFLNTYSILAKQNGISRQAVNKFGRRLFSANAFAAKWVKWWDFVKNSVKIREKPDFSELIDTFSQKIVEFLPRISPRRGPPQQKNLLQGGYRV